MKKFLLRWLGFSLILHLWAGVFTLGYYDFDEHFQILEFMNQRILGLHTGDGKNLAWEFQAQMRPWLQPLIYEAFARIWMFFGDKDPGHWILSFRLISAFLGWLSLVGLSLCSLQWFKKVEWQKNAVRFLCLFWYLPFLHARTSSENFSGTFFWLGFATLTLTLHSTLKMKPRLKTALFLLSGLCLGFSFEFRYQMIIGIVATLGWFLWQRTPRKSYAPVFWTTTGVTLGFFIGTALDFWGYQTLVFAPWNYFYQNIILKRAAEVGVSPFTYYFSDLAEFMPPLGFLTLLGILASWVFIPTHPLNWVVLPYILLHSWIAHKEQRFLYPIWPVFPILAALALEKVQAKMPRFWTTHALFLKRLGIAVAGVSAVVMIYLASKPITARPKFYLSVYRHVPEIRTLYHTGGSPYQYGSGLVLSIYKKPELKLVSVKTPADLPTNEEFWLFHDQFEPPANLLGTHTCELDYTVFPEWLKALTIFSGPARFASRWSLFRCR